MAYSAHSSRGNLSELGPSMASQSSVHDTSRIMDKTWEQVQKKTFTKWVNSKLHVRGLAVSDLTADMTDGVYLIQLLEIIGDENLGKHNKSPKLRIQKVENLNTALAFIKRRGVNLTNIGAEDIVDGNEKLILGMIWTIILRFTIADISEEGLFAKEGLLLWCQRKTAPYAPEVNVKDFTYSWQDGLAFCALIHRHRPDLLDYHSLNKNDKHGNMALAFDVAAKSLNIPKLLDVEDVVDIQKPDERSIMTYVAQYFHAFSELDKFGVAGRRVDKFASVMSSIWEMKNEYEKRARALISLFHSKTDSLKNTEIGDTYSAAKKQSQDFNEYKAGLKREWITEKRELDALLGNIQTKLSTYKLAPYTPPPELSLEKLDESFESLVKAEGELRKRINAKIKTIKENLQVEYAKIANALQSELNHISNGVANLHGELDAQTAKVLELKKSIPRLQEQLRHLQGIAAECAAANIEENEYTIYSVEDLEFDLGVVSTALTKKLGFIENQRVARQMTNVTPQQLDEFEVTFRHFDKDNSNSLSSIEFKAALAGLGFAYADIEFDQIFKRVSDNKVDVTFEPFVKHLTSVTEDKTSSPDQLADAFKALSSQPDFVTENDMIRAGLSQDVIAYLKTAMPQVPGGYDYKAYLKQCFKN